MLTIIEVPLGEELLEECKVIAVNILVVDIEVAIEMMILEECRH